MSSLPSSVAVFNDAQIKFDNQTVVIFGVNRGGTTMVAGAVERLGINLGKDLPVNYEDPDFNLEQLRKNGVAEPKEHIRASVEQRNQQSERWGWKYPKAHTYLREVIEHVRSPRLICVLRDPLATAMRNIKRRQQPPLEGIRNFAMAQRRNTELIEALQVPCLLVSYERASQNPALFVDELQGFIGPCSSTARQQAIAFIGPGAGYQGAEDRPRNKGARALEG